MPMLLHSPADLSLLRHRPYAGPSMNVSVATAQLSSGEFDLGSGLLAPYVPLAYRMHSALVSVHSVAQRDQPIAAPLLHNPHNPQNPHTPLPIPSIEAFLDTTEERLQVAHPSVAPTVREDWPFADAAAATSELSSELGNEIAGPPAFQRGAEHTPLPMWSDDDAIDIMPVSRRELPFDSPSEEEERNGSGLRESQLRESQLRESQLRESLLPESSSPLNDDDERSARSLTAGPSAEAAARALEALATRVRAGELVVPSHAPALGDAAALAAALASLLGVRGQ